MKIRYVSFKGSTYSLYDSPRKTTDDSGTLVYTAIALRVDEEPDQDGFQAAFEVTWVPLGVDCADEDSACDWEHPVSVECKWSYHGHSGNFW